jgi:uncharacterized protein (TIRG00374 family)
MTILSFPKDKLFFLILVSLLISFLKATRFFILLKTVGIKINFLDNLKVFIASQALTPLPGGETMRGLLLKYQTHTSFSYAAGPVVMQAFIEILSSACWVFIGSFIFKILQLPSTITLFLITLFAVFFLNEKVFIYISSSVPRLKLLENYYSYLLIFQKGFKKQFFHSRKNNLFGNIFILSFSLGLLTNILGGFLVFLTAYFYGVDLNILKAIFVFSSSQLLQWIGFMLPAGLGFTEGGMTAILLLFGVNITDALAVVILFRLITLFFTIFLGSTFLIIFFRKYLFVFKNRLEKVYS